MADLCSPRPGNAPAGKAPGEAVTFALPWWRAIIFGGAILCFGIVHPASAETPAPIPAAVADFDNIDTSGESDERTKAHAARVRAFSGMLRDNLAAEARFEIVQLSCPGSPCSADAISPSRFLEAARDSGARLIVYGGIQKMSTLIQIGIVQALDLKTDELVLNQHITFRGDSDEAFLRAAAFVADYLKKAPFSP